MSLCIVLNGRVRNFEALEQPSLAQLVSHLGFRADRIAIELNGNIVSRAHWEEFVLHEADRIELVQFVGGGGPATSSRSRRSQRSP